MTARDCETVVIGLGAMGAATLYQLARRGVEAIGIDRFAPPHVHGSTHGETRITREAIGEGEAYVPLARRSHAIWRELEAATGRSLFVACGAVMIGRDGSTAGRKSGFIGQTIEFARRHDIAHKLLSRRDLAARFPQFIGLRADDVAYHEPGAGYLIPEACVEAQLGEARRLGAEVRTNTLALRIAEDSNGVTIETDRGAIRAARAIVAAGAWTSTLLGPPWDRLIGVTRQLLHWFEPAPPSLYDAAEGCPVYLRFHGDDDAEFFYGFPTPPGAAGVKMATEIFDHRVDLDAPRATDHDAEARRFHAEHVAGRMAGVTKRVIRSARCFYATTADSHFIIDAHPAMPRVTVISACSGHGFKHSAAIGELVADPEGNALLAPFRLRAR